MWGQRMAGSKPCSDIPLSPPQTPSPNPAPSQESPVRCLPPLLLLLRLSDSSYPPRKMIVDREEGIQARQPHRQKRGQVARGLGPMAHPSQHGPPLPIISIHLSYFPQASEDFIARVFRLEFNALNSPKSIFWHNFT